MAKSGPDLKRITEKVRNLVAGCSSEEDLRVGMEMLLREALPNLPTPKYEASVRTSTFQGRADAIHHRLVIEYERPRSMRRRNHRQHAIQQVHDYLSGLDIASGPGFQRSGQDRPLFSSPEYRQESEEHLAASVGLATDGECFVFIRRRAKRWHDDIRRLDEDSVEKLLLWLRAMVRKDLSPEKLIADFGPETQLAAVSVGIMAKLVDSGNWPKANVIYEEWRRIFGIVYGTEQLERSGRGAETQSLISAYRVEVGVKFSTILFALHTYYALLMKVLATEVIVAQGGIGDTFIGCLTRTGLRKQLIELESGEILQRYNIRNAIEQDFFGWYTSAWTPELHDVLWGMMQTLSEYDVGTFEIRPSGTRDLLKDLYHGLVPESVRHALGEYYTPDWLAEHTIDLAGYDGDPHKSFLDPSCGSGTFLVMAIQKVRQWLSDRQVEWGSNHKKREAVNLIRHNIIGFDLNPLAVIASRTNYLFALGPLLRYRGSSNDFEIPVYLTDSVLLPGRTLTQPSLFAKDTIPFPMTVGTFAVPRDVVEKRQVPDLMNLLHDAIVNDHARDSFVSRAVAELKLKECEPLVVALDCLFDAMKELDRQGKNRVWAKLIRNR